MPKDRDIDQVRSVARQYGISEGKQLWEFCKLIHTYKEEGFRGTKNTKGDFTYQELCELAKEFIENQD